jgi:chemotaxis family two-component system response regulator Rcp1
MRSVEILLVEDNPGDALLTRQAFADSRIPCRISVARDGVEGLAYLRQEAGFAQAVMPDLILLDLNMPRKDGRELLADIKQDPQLRRIPVIVLTTSNADNDILRSYNLHANAYITKPIDLDQFVDIVRAIEEFWFSIVTLPRST